MKKDIELVIVFKLSLSWLENLTRYFHRYKSQLSSTFFRLEY